MSKSKAFTKHIHTRGSSPSENGLVNQSSPAWVLTFVRWNVRDTLRAIPATGNGKELFDVRDPLVVENDCIQVTVNVNKSNLTDSMNAVLLETDVNYSTAIHPGDFVLVNMLNWPTYARRVANAARSKPSQPINGEDDGFKGIFKVQGIRKEINADPATGIVRVFYKINAFAFTEFNNSIYYNPYMLSNSSGSTQNQLIFASNISKDYANMLDAKKNIDCQDLIKMLIESFIGVGIGDHGESEVQGTIITANTHFYIPKQIAALLGVPAAAAAKDVYNYQFGIQQYGGPGSQSLASGMNPSNLESPSKGRFSYTDSRCLGQTLLKAEYWNQQKAWGILNQYTNAPFNELYSCFKIDTNGRVMPTIVFRQIPFSTDAFGKIAPFESASKVTRFSNLPRWKIDPALVFKLDIGMDESARFNFVQVYVAPPSVGDPGAFMSGQTAANNYVYDVNDVTRSGLRPYVVSSTFQDFTIASSPDGLKVGRIWAMILGDSLMGGHLKLNGSIECVGIVDPIAVGDNLEFDATIFHIEEVNHTCSINPENGMKNFRTLLKLSNGVSVLTNDANLAYSEMLHTSAYEDRADNFNNGNKILPGISEEQSVVYRPNGPQPTDSDIYKGDRPFAQPGTKITPLKDDDVND